MSDLTKAFVLDMNAGKLWAAFLLLAIYYILKKEPFKIVAHYFERKDREHELAKALLETGKLSSNANNFLQEHLEQLAFRKYYGISASRKMRSALINLYENNQNNIGWHHFIRAYYHLKLVDGRLIVQITRFDTFLRWLVSTLCILVGGYAVVAIALGILSASSLGQEKFFILTGFSLLLLFAAGFFSSLNWPYHSAKIIKKAIAG